MTSLILYVVLALIGAGMFIMTVILARNPVAERPEFGTRGLKRTAALEDGLFAMIEPPIRVIAGWMEGIRAPKLKAHMAKQVTHSGDWRGMSANEILAMSLLYAVFGVICGLIGVYTLDFASITVVLAGMLGAFIPYLNLQSASKERFVQINRTLPAAIDLAALCMGAGLDFPGALVQIVEKSSSRSAALVEEVSRILQELDLGHTRRRALEGFAERCPTEAVRDFVGTVVQAEAKGTPLADVLTIQARMLRMRRSVMAEEAAARAGLMMMGPLMMMFVVILALLMGPFFVRFTTSGF